MGNSKSKQTTKSQQSNNCLICLEDIHDVFSIKCNICNIYLHNRCEIQFRKYKGYTVSTRICPHCNQKNTLEDDYNLENGKNKANIVYHELMRSLIDEIELDMSRKP